MIRKIIIDENLLNKKSEYRDFDKQSMEDIRVIIGDLLDTAHDEPRCLGLAANQIGYNLRIFVFKWGDKFLVAMNPHVIGQSESIFPSYESCLSRPGREPVKVYRYKRIKVRFLDQYLDMHTMKLSGRAAVEFQHELDHLEGILI